MNIGNSEKSILIPNITFGYVIPFSYYDKLLLFDDLPKNIDTNSNYLLIYAIYPKLSRITCYPISVNEIWKIKLILSSANTDIVEKVTRLYRKCNIIHTTGLTEKDKMFIIEIYIMPSQNRKIKAKIIDLIKNCEAILAYKVDVLSIFQGNPSI